MSLEIAWKQNILVTDSNLLKSLLVVFGLGLQAFICEFSRQNICSAGSLGFLGCLEGPGGPGGPGGSGGPGGMRGLGGPGKSHFLL